MGRAAPGSDITSSHALACRVCHEPELKARSKRWFSYRRLASFVPILADAIWSQNASSARSFGMDALLLKPSGRDVNDSKPRGIPNS